MRNLTTKSLCLLSMLGFLTVATLQGQSLQRSTMPQAADKVSATTELLPCSGSVLFSEDFENGIPAGWIVIDADTFTPRTETQLAKGWQSRADYRDSLNNKVVVSPSWYRYTTTGKSNDWLISPLITLGSNSCLSWRAFSQDQYFKESYEVRIATVADTTAFLANAALLTVAAESGTPHFTSASLLAYAGQSVYIAFRQTSQDRFVLCLDDVRVSNVNTLDIGAYAITYGAPDIGDTVRMRFQVANYGSDTVRSFQALYTVDGGAPKSMAITAVSLPPNSTVAFNHDSLYVSDSIDAFLPLCAWTVLPNAAVDQDITNDTLCVTMTVGHPVGTVDPRVAMAQLQVYPNPFSSAVSLRVDGLQRPTQATVTVLDLQGRLLQQHAARLVSGAPISLDLSALAAGMYVVKVQVTGGKHLQTKLIKH
jgi:Secretion system C-terminal sorting domain/Cleaved Adhesin Domain